MLAYIPYMDPMGMEMKIMSETQCHKPIIWGLESHPLKR